MLKRLPIIITILVISGFYYVTAATVPFHPDEATQIFMSADMNQLWNNPEAVFYSANPTEPLRQHYRLVDAPLTRYFVGFSLAVFGEPLLPTDWDWSKTWEENSAAGALHSQSQLIAARFFPYLAFPLMLYLAYLFGRHTLSNWVSLVLVILVGINSLVLLHTRRAMAESFLLLGCFLLLFLLTRPKISPWLLGLAAAFTINAKQTAISFIPVIIVVFLAQTNTSWKQRLSELTKFVFILLVTTYLLNPIIWKEPITAIQAGIRERSTLISNQVTAFSELMPDRVLNDPIKKFAGLIGNLYFTRPAIQDVGNYTQSLAQYSDRYLSNPINSLTRSPVAAMLLLALSLLGAGFAALTLRTKQLTPPFIVLMACVSQVAAILIGLQLPFQRYMIPIVPYVAWFAAYSIETIHKVVKQKQPAN
jgi:4-amino-4-deoxy-L-arabinose transferase-like glycosyltransferase